MKPDGSFYLEDVHWKPQINGKIACMVASGRQLTVATESGRILRWRWDTGDIKELDFLRPDSVIRLFQDNQYISHRVSPFLKNCQGASSSDCPRLIRKFLHCRQLRKTQTEGTHRNEGSSNIFNIVSHGQYFFLVFFLIFFQATTPESTGEFLIGTSSGAVLRSCIEKEKEKYCKPAFELIGSNSFPLSH